MGVDRPPICPISSVPIAIQVMTIWQADFYRRPLQNQAGQPLWELLVCTPDKTFTASAFCPQSEANSAWLTMQLSKMAGDRTQPEQIQIFRPQCLSLIEAACKPLGITVEPTRHVDALKQLLQERAEQYPRMENYTGQPYQALELEKPPPAPLPEMLWGKQWRFAAIAASDLISAFQHRPIPIVEMPDSLLPLNLQLSSTTLIPGVVIDAARQSMRLARWLQDQRPVALNYIPGSPDGLILEAGLVDRWILHTFEDPEVIAAARTFRERQQVSKGIHFLLVQPDDSGMTYSGFWLLSTTNL
jgi:hypothetical protein